MDSQEGGMSATQEAEPMAAGFITRAFRYPAWRPVEGLEDFGAAIRLKRELWANLIVSGCAALASLPDLPEVQTLDVSDCASLPKLPKLPKVGYLDVRGCAARVSAMRQ